MIVHCIILLLLSRLLHDCLLKTNKVKTLVMGRKMVVKSTLNKSLENENDDQSSYFTMVCDNYFTMSYMYKDNLMRLEIPIITYLF